MHLSKFDFFLFLDKKKQISIQKPNFSDSKNGFKKKKGDNLCQMNRFNLSNFTRKKKEQK
jgi:hypothetical protein